MVMNKTENFYNCNLNNNLKKKVIAKSVWVFQYSAFQIALKEMNKLDSCGSEFVIFLTQQILLLTK